jgi:outer membrane protein, heavy metal efflux system
MRLVWRICLGLAVIACSTSSAMAQTPLTWQTLRDRFRATNPVLQAGAIGVDELKATELTAFLRPNPLWSLTLDQVGSTQTGTPFSASNLVTAFSYLHERQHQRELRLDSAEAATSIGSSAQADLDRTLVYVLRAGFVQVLQAKAFRALAENSLANYDQVLAVSRERFQSGDIAQIDLDRLELQRVTYASDVQTADVNLRSAKIQLLRLLNDHTTAIEQFDVDGPFDFALPVVSLDELHGLALSGRPDLRAAAQAVDKAKTDHRLAVANGAADPIFSVDGGFPSISQAFLSYQPPLRQYLGVSVGVPLRLFDRNQGEKLRTTLDITRNERLADATRMQVFADVDTAFEAVQSTVVLLRPYREQYLTQATRVRDTVQFSYQRGGASLVDFLQAQQEYRSVQISYVNLIAAYLNAVNQLNEAVGQEVIP